ncbi:unnamed protein product [Prunus armeniaca]
MKFVSSAETEPANTTTYSEDSKSRGQEPGVIFCCQEMEGFQVYTNEALYPSIHQGEGEIKPTP